MATNPRNMLVPPEYIAQIRSNLVQITRRLKISTMFLNGLHQEGVIDEVFKQRLVHYANHGEAYNAATDMVEHIMNHVSLEQYLKFKNVLQTTNQLAVLHLLPGTTSSPAYGSWNIGASGQRIGFLHQRQFARESVLGTPSENLVLHGGTDVVSAPGGQGIVNQFPITDGSGSVLGAMLWEVKGYNFGQATFLPNGNLAVTVFEDKKVLLYSCTGQKLTEKILRNKPQGITYHPEGILVSFNSIAVAVLDLATLKEIKTMVIHSMVQYGICILNDGSIVSTSQGFDKQINILRQDGGFTTTKINTTEANFQPRYVSSDLSDNLYVTEGETGIIHIYSRQGDLRRAITNGITKCNRVAVDHNGNIWVGDRGIYCLTVISGNDKILGRHLVNRITWDVTIKDYMLCVISSKDIKCNDMSLSVYRLM